MVARARRGASGRLHELGLSSITGDVAGEDVAGKLYGTRAHTFEELASSARWPPCRGPRQQLPTEAEVCGVEAEHSMWWKPRESRVTVRACGG